PLMALDALPKSPRLMVFVGARGTPPPPPPLPTPISKMVSAAPISPNAAPVQPPSAITKETGFETSVRQALPAIQVGHPGVPESLVDNSARVVQPAPVDSPSPQPRAAAAEPVRIGGNIKAPTRLKAVNPTYPSIAQATRVQGIVIVEATIGVD